jgi:hypothetical protein
MKRERKKKGFQRGGGRAGTYSSGSCSGLIWWQRQFDSLIGSWQAATVNDRDRDRDHDLDAGVKIED